MSISKIVSNAIKQWFLNLFSVGGKFYSGKDTPKTGKIRKARFAKKLKKIRPKTSIEEVYGAPVENHCENAFNKWKYCRRKM